MDMTTFILICTIINLICIGLTYNNTRRMKRIKEQIALLNGGISADLKSMEDILDMLAKRSPRMPTTKERNELIDEEE